MSFSTALDEVLDLASYRLSQLKESNDPKSLPDYRRAQTAYDVVSEMTSKIKPLEDYVAKRNLTESGS